MIPVRENPVRDMLDLTDVLVEHAAVTTALDQACRDQWWALKVWRRKERSVVVGSMAADWAAQCAHRHEEALRLALGVRGILRRTQRERARARKEKRTAHV